MWYAVICKQSTTEWRDVKRRSSTHPYPTKAFIPLCLLPIYSKFIVIYSVDSLIHLGVDSFSLLFYCIKINVSTSVY